jgi:hypothetical protein
MIWLLILIIIIIIIIIIILTEKSYNMNRDKKILLKKL